MTSSSENPMSNIVSLRIKRRPGGRLCWGPCRRSGLVLGLFLDFALDRLARHLRCGARVGSLVAALAHAVLEAAHGAAEVRADVAQLLGAENQHHDHQDDQPVPNAERTHTRLLFPPLQHRTEGLRPAEDVHMEMIHLLMPLATRVDDRAKTVGGPLFARQLSGERKHLAQGPQLAHPGLIQRRQVLLRHDEEMHRRLRPDVVEGKHVVILVDLLRRDLAARDLAENAVGVVHFFLAAFSSMPEMPSRRRISASTSPGPRPWRASTIMQWNQRSAVSRTRCRRSPLFAASTVSVASSPIFFSSASSPCASSRAT